jgi:peptidoglycan/xylan/chitin deacetylase (PgdA/CDA1 family)
MLMLEAEIGQKPKHMAYPYGYAGAVGAREVALAREAGYASAVTTRHGVLRAEHAAHLHALPRISVNGRYQRVAHPDHAFGRHQAARQHRQDGGDGLGAKQKAV